MRISDWSSDVCSSDLFERRLGAVRFRFWIKLRNEKGDFALDLQGRDGRGMVAEPIAGRVTPIFPIAMIVGRAVGELQSSGGEMLLGVSPFRERGSRDHHQPRKIAEASCRDSVCQAVCVCVVTGASKKKRKRCKEA